MTWCWVRPSADPSATIRMASRRSVSKAAMACAAGNSTPMRHMPSLVGFFHTVRWSAATRARSAAPAGSTAIAAFLASAPAWRTDASGRADATSASTA